MTGGPGGGRRPAPADRRPVYMIGVAAELAGMHPQTLRIYERRGLVDPGRTQGNTRLYSASDIERLRLIARLTGEVGLNLSGVERVLALTDEAARLRRRVAVLEDELARTRVLHRAELDTQRRAFSRELVVRSHSTAVVPISRSALRTRTP